MSLNTFWTKSVLEKMSTKPMIAMPPSLTDEGSNIGTQSSVQYHLSTNYFQDTLNTQFLQKSIELGNNMVENDFLNTQCYSNPSQSQFGNHIYCFYIIQYVLNQIINFFFLFRQPAI